MSSTIEKCVPGATVESVTNDVTASCSTVTSPRIERTSTSGPWDPSTISASATALFDRAERNRGRESRLAVRVSGYREAATGPLRAARRLEKKNPRGHRLLRQQQRQTLVIACSSRLPSLGFQCRTEND